MSICGNFLLNQPNTHSLLLNFILRGGISGRNFLRYQRPTINFSQTAQKKNNMKKNNRTIPPYLPRIPRTSKTPAVINKLLVILQLGQNAFQFQTIFPAITRGQSQGTTATPRTILPSATTPSRPPGRTTQRLLSIYLLTFPERERETGP